jgi:hypothetical protein
MTLDPYRQAQLEANLKLSLLWRVLESERMARVFELRAPRARCERLLMFDRYEDYAEWKDREDRAP